VAQIDLGQPDAGRIRPARPGDVVVIQLDEAPTSGYRWQVEEVDPDALTPAGDEFRPPVGADRGGRGQRELRFTVSGPALIRVRLVLRRGWQGADPAARRYEVTIDATGTD
jgi:inhibitor of cysteine peptidase